jgi:hypothetical protein
MTTGIKETMEMLEGVKVLGMTGKQVFADGKVNLADLPAAMGLLTQFAMLAEAVKGVDQIPTEAKDLSMEEANMLIAKILEVVNVFKAA